MRKKVMKNKQKVKAAVALCVAGLHVPESSSEEAEIMKIGLSQGIHIHEDMRSFVKNVIYNWKKQRHNSKEELGGVPKKWYKLLLFSVIIIAILFALFITMFPEEQSITVEPHLRVCLTMYKIAFSDSYSVNTSND